MPPLLLTLLAVLAAYLLGSVPFAMIASRVFGLADPRTYGSKNPGATNVLRSGSKAAAALTLIGDIAKGLLAVALAKHHAPTLGLPDYTVGLVAVSVFFGHLYSVFLGFKGGKGVATAAGILLALDWVLGALTLGTWLLVALLSRFSSLAALLAAVASPMYALLLWGRSATILFVGIIAMALIGKHWANLQRLMAGSEPKIGEGKRKPDQPTPVRTPR